MEKLGDRKHNILCLAIEEYIKDASPITSNGVQHSLSENLSTATLRNELNALEAMGFLKQLHTSGGRVPTPLGYRYYVNDLLKDLAPPEEELEKVRTIVEDRTNSLSDIVSSIADVISQATNYPTVVILNGLEKLVLVDIKIVPLVSDKLLVLLGTPAGYIQNTIHAKATLEASQDASKFFTKYFKGKTIGYMIENIYKVEEEMEEELDSFINIVSCILDVLKTSINKKVIDVRREGATKLLEQGELESTKKILNLLDSEDELTGILSEGEDEISVILPDEEKMSGLSVVKASVNIGGTNLASIGVLGPQRMDYSSIASALKVVVDELKAKGDDEN